MRSVIYLFCLFSFFIIPAQEKKIEKETKLKNKDVPIRLKQMLEDYLMEAEKLNFYLESNGTKKNYEAKFLYKQAYYSIEYDDSIRLEDVEVIVSEADIPPGALEKIIEYLAGFDKFKIEKIQKQFSSEEWSDEEIINKALREGIGDIVRYEIEVGVKIEGKWQALEMLFTDDGQFISQREIIHRSSEFVLY